MKAMLFVDGENLVMRYQAMIDSGRKAAEGIQHERDLFVWHPQLTLFTQFDLIRVSYYTSVVGDDNRVSEAKNKLAAIIYEFASSSIRGSGQIYPCVFKKPSKSQKTRSVDIHIVIDVMRYAHNPAIDHIVIASGDGDYLPLVTEAMRTGKQVYVAALSSGLNSALRYSVDEFVDLDRMFFRPSPEELAEVGPST